MKVIRTVDVHKAADDLFGVRITKLQKELKVLRKKVVELELKCSEARMEVVEVVEEPKQIGGGKNAS